MPLPVVAGTRTWWEKRSLPSSATSTSITSEPLRTLPRKTGFWGIWRNPSCSAEALETSEKNGGMVLGVLMVWPRPLFLTWTSALALAST